MDLFNVVSLLDTTYIGTLSVLVSGTRANFLNCLVLVLFFCMYINYTRTFANVHIKLFSMRDCSTKSFLRLYTTQQYNLIWFSVIGCCGCCALVIIPIRCFCLLVSNTTLFLCWSFLWFCWLYVECERDESV